MGPMYFTSLRKIQIVVIRIDGILEQLNFLIDDNKTIGKEAHGINSALSMIDWATPTNGFGELTSAVHADN